MSVTVHGRAKLNSYSSLPRIGASPLIWVPSAARTCCDWSETSSSILGITSWRRVSRSRSAQKPMNTSAICQISLRIILTRNLPRNSTPHLRLSVLEKLHECGYQVSVDNLLIYGFRDLDSISLALVSLPQRAHLFEPVSDHVAHPPALVLKKTPQGCQEHTMA